MPIEEVIFLGAGASAADGAPTQITLFKDYFEHRPHTDEITRSLSQFFKDFFGIDTTHNLNNTDFPTFEEVLGILELSLSRYESFRGYPLIPSNTDKNRELVVTILLFDIPEFTS